MLTISRLGAVALLAAGCAFSGSDSASRLAPSEAATAPTTGTGNGAGVLTAGIWDDNRNFEHFLRFLDGFTSQSGMPTFTRDEHEVANENHELVAHERLDISLVIDATGSMADEMAYLQAEFQALSSTIDTRFPDAEQRWSLVVYRDRTDEYVTRVFDFTTDLEEFQTNLSRQSADGGGDFPEASHAALRDMNQLSWRADADVARLVFWVADAPHHAAQAGMISDVVREARDREIHIYPVASSGIDNLTEFTMRATAQLTDARYIFLTDDSGIGAAHQEPTVPCYLVTHLDDAILRMTAIEMSGVYEAPAAEDIIRSAGDPTDGACTIDDGVTVAVF